MSRFNRYLRGWLGLLDGKVGGFTPAETLDQVRPTLDTYPFIHAQMRELVTGGTGGLAGGAEGFNPVATLLVPNDEIWFVEQATCVTEAGVAVAEHLCCAPSVQVRSRSLGIPKDIILGQFVAPEWGSTFAYRAFGISNRPYIALPGDQFGVYVSLIDTAATIEVILNLLISRSPT